MNIRYANHLFLALIALLLLTISPANSVLASDEVSTSESVSDMTHADLESFIRDYLVANPDVIIDSLAAYESQKQNAAKESFKVQLKENKDFLFENEITPSIGPEDAEVQIVEFFDYNCGYCKRALMDIQKLLENDPNVRVILKELPILSDSSRAAAQYALASALQGDQLYFDYHVAIMEYTGPKNEQNLESIAEKVGLDVEKLKKDARSEKIRNALIENLQLSQKLGIRGTPAFIIGDTLAPGYVGYDNLVEAVKIVRGQTN